MADLLTGGLQIVGGIAGLFSSNKSAKKQAAMMERYLNEILKSPYQRLSPYEQGVYQNYINYVNNIITGQGGQDIADIYLGRAKEAINISYNQMLGQTLRGIKSATGGRLSGVASGGAISSTIGDILPKLYAQRQQEMSKALGSYASLRQQDIQLKGSLGLSGTQLMAQMKSPSATALAQTVPSISNLLTNTQQAGANAFSSILSGVEKFTGAGILKNVFSPQPQIVPANPTIKEYGTKYISPYGVIPDLEVPAFGSSLTGGF